ncbi:MAG: zinc ribbon domain-containing protein [Eubacteriales bacterium]
MKPKYIIKEVHIRSENRKKDGLEFVIGEGDIILDKGFRFEVLPARFDFTKPITRKKISNSPQKPSERLLRIKELGEDSAVVAILGQETYYEGEDTLVTKETERLKTVKYGEKFCVWAKDNLTLTVYRVNKANGEIYNSPSAITYEFIIADESKQQEQKVQKFCTECGAKLTMGDKFCRECGTPVLK